MHTEEKTKPLKAEDGADFVATLEATAEGPQAFFTVTSGRTLCINLPGPRRRNRKVRGIRSIGTV
jgi:hypothetical protein